MTGRYDEDVVLWSEEQARALRGAADAGWNAPIDWEHVAEEIESLGLSERRALASHIGTVIEQLLKLQASPAEQPERLRRDSIRRARHEVDKLLRASPSLRREVAAVIAEEMVAARSFVRNALADHDEQPRLDLEQLTYGEAEVLGDWMPPRR